MYFCYVLLQFRILDDFITFWTLSCSIPNESDSLSSPFVPDDFNVVSSFIGTMGKYFSKVPKLFPTPKKAFPQQNTQFQKFSLTVLF